MMQRRMSEIHEMTEVDMNLRHKNYSEIWQDEINNSHFRVETEH